MIDSIGFALTNYVVYIIPPQDMKQSYREGIIFKPTVSITKKTPRRLTPVKMYGVPLRVTFIKKAIPESLIKSYLSRKREYVLGRLSEGLED
jgi:hypothetical protein